jgi:hypothetical protein
MKIRSVVTELFNADGRQIDRQTDMTKLVVSFRNFANAPKINFLPHKNISTSYQKFVCVTETECVYCAVRTVFMCFVWISEQTAIISLYSIS